MDSLEIGPNPLIQHPNLTNIEVREEELNEEPNEKLLGQYNSTHFSLTLMTITANVFLQTILLSEGKYFQIALEYKGITLSIGLIIQFTTYLTLSGTYIHLARKFGIRNLIRYGAIIYMLGCFFSLTEIPFLSSFFVCQFLFGNASTALLVVPWKSSDSSDVTKTKASVDYAASIFLITQVVPNLMSIFSFWDMPWPSYFLYAFAIPFVGLIIESFFIEDKYLQNQVKETTRRAQVMQIVKSNRWLLILIILRGALTLFFGAVSTFALLHYHSYLVLADHKDPIITSRAFSQIMFSVPVLASRLYSMLLNKDNENLTINLAVFSCVSSAIFFFASSLFGYTLSLVSTISSLISALGGTGIFMISDNIHRRFISPDERKIVREYLRTVQIIPLMILVLICGLLYDYWMPEAAIFLIGLVLVACVPHENYINYP